MANESADPRSIEYRDQMNAIYSEGLHGFYQAVSRGDLYGLAGRSTAAAFLPQLCLSTNSTVLDLCCGPGGPARYMAQTFGCKVVGVDISEANIRIANANASEARLTDKLTFMLGNVLTADIPGAFTHVFGFDAWCYFPDKAPLYDRAFRSLSPGGTVAFLDLSCEDRRHFRYERALGAVHYESKAGYAAKLTKAGFRSVQILDLNQPAIQDMAEMLLAIIALQDLPSSDQSFFSTVLGVWGEALGSLSVGMTSYVGCIGSKPSTMAAE